MKCLVGILFLGLSGVSFGEESFSVHCDTGEGLPRTTADFSIVSGNLEDPGRLDIKARFLFAYEHDWYEEATFHWNEEEGVVAYLDGTLTLSWDEGLEGYWGELEHMAEWGPHNVGFPCELTTPTG